jgi:uroporphyrinogen-III synthase
VLATSANGIRGFAARSVERDLRVYAVGPQTAAEARAFGFHDVISAGGDSAALAAMVMRMANPGKGRLLHAAGAETAGRLREVLESGGFDVQTLVLYEAVAVDSLSAQAEDLLRQNLLDGVLLFSPRSGAIFSTLVSRPELAASCENITAFCISPATAAAVSAVKFARVAVAAAPDQAAMLDMIGTMETRQ